MRAWSRLSCVPDVNISGAAATLTQNMWSFMRHLHTFFFFNEGSPRSPLKTSVIKSGSGLTIHWIPGDTGAGHVTGYVIEARPSGV